MKILIVTAEFGTNGGGLSLSCHKLYELLSEHEEVFILDSSTRPIKVTLGGYSSELPNAISLEYKLKTDANMYQNIDIVIGFGGGFNGYYASLLSSKLNSRFIISLRGSDVNLAKWNYVNSWYLQNSIKRAEKIICLSHEMIKNVILIDKKVEHKLRIIPNAIAANFKPIKFVNLPDSLKIGCSSSHLNEKKGITDLLYMVYEFKQISEMPIILELIGDIDEDLKEGYENIIGKLGIQDNIRFYEKVDRNSLSKIMNDWDFYVQSSVCEGIPNSIVEALQSGTAFISTKSGYISELLIKDFPQFFFEDFHPDAMAKHIKSLIELPNKEYLYNEASKHLTQNCQIEEIRNEWLKILINKPPKKELNIDQIISVALHDVCHSEHDSITTPIEVFKIFVQNIVSAGYGLCSMKKYLEMDSEERKHWIICTFDDGYEGLKKYAYPILNKYGFTATVFVCTDLIGKDNNWNTKDWVNRQHLTFTELDELHNGGWEIGSHGVHHYNLLKLSDDGIQHELSYAKEIIKGRWHYAETYAYPYGAYNDFIKSCVGRYYKYAFAVTKGGTSLLIDNLQIRRYSITEIYKMLSIIP